MQGLSMWLDCALIDKVVVTCCFGAWKYGLQLQFYTTKYTDKQKNQQRHIFFFQFSFSFFFLFQEVQNRYSKNAQQVIQEIHIPHLTTHIHHTSHYFIHSDTQHWTEQFPKKTSH